MDHDFVRLAYEVRKAQKAYFRSRTAENLAAAKNLEAALDVAIESKLRPRAMGLFDGDEWSNTRPHTEDKL